jgi:hypothetical protein
MLVLQGFKKITWFSEGVVPVKVDQQTVRLTLVQNCPELFDIFFLVSGKESDSAVCLHSVNSTVSPYWHSISLASFSHELPDYHQIF